MKSWRNTLVALDLTVAIASCWITCDAQTVVNRRAIVGGALSIDDTTAQSFGVAGSHTLPVVIATDANYIAVGVGVRVGETISSVTVGGQAMTLVNTTDNGTQWISWYEKISPLTGSRNVVVTYSGDRTAVVCAISFKNASVSNPSVNTNEAGGTGTNCTIDITSGTGQIPMAMAFQEDPDEFVAGAGDTIFGLGPELNGDKGVALYSTGAASVTISAAQANSRAWVMAGFSVTQ